MPPIFSSFSFVGLTLVGFVFFPLVDPFHIAIHKIVSVVVSFYFQAPHTLPRLFSRNCILSIRCVNGMLLAFISFMPSLVEGAGDKQDEAPVCMPLDDDKWQGGNLASFTLARIIYISELVGFAFEWRSGNSYRFCTSLL